MESAKLRGVRVAATVILPLALVACATSSPPPDSDLAAARTAILQAEPVAYEYAPAELRLAQDKLSRAERAMTRDDWREARRLAEEAEADARYARALAENERIRRE